jgi:hypothetical protein
MCGDVLGICGYCRGWGGSCTCESDCGLRAAHGGPPCQWFKRAAGNEER